MDSATDAEIGRVIQNHFQRVTMLIIAHRLLVSLAKSM